MSLRVNRNVFVALPAVAALASFTGLITTPTHGQELPSLINVVDYTKLLPLLPEAPAGWTADKPNGSTTDVGGFKLTNVHRDYRKGEGDNVPTTAISILDSAANPDYVEATTAAWKFTTTSTEGYSKSVNLDGHAVRWSNNGPVHLLLRRQEYPSAIRYDICPHNNDQPDPICRLCSRSPVHRKWPSECETL